PERGVGARCERRRDGGDVSRWRALVLEVELGLGRHRRRAYLREPTGRDEMTSGSGHAWVASELISRLLVEAPGAAVGPAAGSPMTVCDRDRLVAALHVHCFGDPIESHVTCQACGKRFEFSFSLVQLLGSLYGE